MSDNSPPPPLPAVAQQPRREGNPSGSRPFLELHSAQPGPHDYPAASAHSSDFSPEQSRPSTNPRPIPRRPRYVAPRGDDFGTRARPHIPPPPGICRPYHASRGSTTYLGRRGGFNSSYHRYQSPQFSRGRAHRPANVGYRYHAQPRVHGQSIDSSVPPPAISSTVHSRDSSSQIPASPPSSRRRDANPVRRRNPDDSNDSDTLVGKSVSPGRPPYDAHRDHSPLSSYGSKGTLKRNRLPPLSPGRQPRGLLSSQICDSLTERGREASSRFPLQSPRSKSPALGSFVKESEPSSRCRENPLSGSEKCDSSTSPALPSSSNPDVAKSEPSVMRTDVEDIPEDDTLAQKEPFSETDNLGLPMASHSRKLKTELQDSFSCDNACLDRTPNVTLPPRALQTSMAHSHCKSMSVVAHESAKVSDQVASIGRNTRAIQEMGLPMSRSDAVITGAKFSVEHNTGNPSDATGGPKQCLSREEPTAATESSSARRSPEARQQSCRKEPNSSIFYETASPAATGALSRSASATAMDRFRSKHRDEVKYKNEHSAAICETESGCASGVNCKDAEASSKWSAIERDNRAKREQKFSRHITSSSNRRILSLSEDETASRVSKASPVSTATGTTVPTLQIYGNEQNYPSKCLSAPVVSDRRSSLALQAPSVSPREKGDLEFLREYTGSPQKVSSTTIEGDSSVRFSIPRSHPPQSPYKSPSPSKRPRSSSLNIDLRTTPCSSHSQLVKALPEMPLAATGDLSRNEPALSIPRTKRCMEPPSNALTTPRSTVRSRRRSSYCNETSGCTTLVDGELDSTHLSSDVLESKSLSKRSEGLYSAYENRCNGRLLRTSSGRSSIGDSLEPPATSFSSASAKNEPVLCSPQSPMHPLAKTCEQATFSSPNMFASEDSCLHNSSPLYSRACRLPAVRVKLSPRTTSNTPHSPRKNGTEQRSTRQSPRLCEQGGSPPCNAVVTSPVSKEYSISGSSNLAAAQISRDHVRGGQLTGESLNSCNATSTAPTLRNSEEESSDYQLALSCKSHLPAVSTSRLCQPLKNPAPSLPDGDLISNGVPSVADDSLAAVQVSNDLPSALSKGGTGKELANHASTPRLSETSVDVILHRLLEVDRAVNAIDRRIFEARERLKATVIARGNDYSSQIPVSRVKDEFQSGERLCLGLAAEEQALAVAKQFKARIFRHVEFLRPVRPPHHQILIEILEDNRCRAASSIAQLRHLCSVPERGLNLSRVKNVDLCCGITLTNYDGIRNVIRQRTAEYQNKNRILRDELSQRVSSWQRKVKQGRDKRSREKREASRERDRFLFRSIKREEFLPTARTSSGRATSKAQNNGSSSRVANGSDIDYLLHAYETEGGASHARGDWRKTLAVIPEQNPNIPPLEAGSVLIEDPVLAVSHARAVNMWTREEILIFLEKFVIYSKQFKRIADCLEHKSVGDVVQFYYQNKLRFNLRQLQLRRRSTKKSELISLAGFHSTFDVIKGRAGLGSGSPAAGPPSSLTDACLSDLELPTHIYHSETVMKSPSPKQSTKEGDSETQLEDENGESLGSAGKSLVTISSTKMGLEESAQGVELNLQGSTCRRELKSKNKSLETESENAKDRSREGVKEKRQDREKRREKSRNKARRRERSISRRMELGRDDGADKEFDADANASFSQNLISVSNREKTPSKCVEKANQQMILTSCDAENQIKVSENKLTAVVNCARKIVLNSDDPQRDQILANAQQGLQSNSRKVGCEDSHVRDEDTRPTQIVELSAPPETLSMERHEKHLKQNSPDRVLVSQSSRLEGKSLKPLHAARNVRSHLWKSEMRDYSNARHVLDSGKSGVRLSPSTLGSLSQSREQLRALFEEKSCYSFSAEHGELIPFDENCSRREVLDGPMSKQIEDTKIEAGCNSSTVLGHGYSEKHELSDNSCVLDSEITESNNDQVQYEGEGQFEKRNLEVSMPYQTSSRCVTKEFPLRPPRSLEGELSPELNLRIGDCFKTGDNTDGVTNPQSGDSLKSAAVPLKRRQAHDFGSTTESPCNTSRALNDSNCDSVEASKLSKSPNDRRSTVADHMSCAKGEASPSVLKGVSEIGPVKASISRKMETIEPSSAEACHGQQLPSPTLSISGQESSEYPKLRASPEGNLNSRKRMAAVAEIGTKDDISRKRERSSPSGLPEAVVSESISSNQGVTEKLPAANFVVKDLRSPLVSRVTVNSQETSLSGVVKNLAGGSYPSSAVPEGNSFHPSSAKVKGSHGPKFRSTPLPMSNLSSLGERSSLSAARMTMNTPQPWPRLLSSPLAASPRTPGVTTPRAGSSTRLRELVEMARAAGFIPGNPACGAEFSAPIGSKKSAPSTEEALAKPESKE